MGEKGGPSIVRVFEGLLKRVLDESLTFYGDRLTSLVVFGSVGRGTPTKNSDIDLLVIAKVLPFGRIPRVREFDAIEKRLEPDLKAARQLGVNTRFSPIFRTEAEMELGGLIFLDMTRGARILFDRSSFFRKYLEELKDRLDAMKTVRIDRGSTWYWVLKPDLRPGEVIDI